MGLWRALPPYRAQAARQGVLRAVLRRPVLCRCVAGCPHDDACLPNVVRHVPEPVMALCMPHVGITGSAFSRWGHAPYMRRSPWAGTNCSEARLPAWRDVIGEGRAPLFLVRWVSARPCFPLER